MTEPTELEPDTLASLAGLARELLAFQGELGLRGLDLPADVLADPKASPAPAERSRPRAPEPGAPTARPASRTPRPTPTARNLAPALRAIREELGECTRCKLHAGRTSVVFGAGSAPARLMFIGEAPGRDEDLQGEPFVGEAGQLLDRMIAAMGLARRDVYLAYAVKCRPSGHRAPEPDEVAACESFMRQQIQAVKPEVVVALGAAAQTLLRETTPITRLRGQWREYEGVPLMPTFDPAYLLRNAAEKRQAWEDLQQVMRRLGLAGPRPRP